MFGRWCFVFLVPFWRLNLSDLWLPVIHLEDVVMLIWAFVCQ